MSEDNFDDQEKESSLPVSGSIEQIVAKYDQTHDNFKNLLEKFVDKVLEDNPPSNNDAN